MNWGSTSSQTVSERVLPDRHHPVATSRCDDELGMGAIAGEYVIQGLIARGGCATVYRAEHRLLSRRAAIKVLARDLVGSPSMLTRFVSEARIMCRLRHPNIVDVYEFG